MTMEFNETLHFLESSDGPRFAIVTHPSGPRSSTGVVLCNGGWPSGSWYFNRLLVKLARSLASKGHTVVRFDWYGSGESPGFLERFDLAEPLARDVVRAATLLDRSQRVVGVGVCFGAVSLLAAAHSIEKLDALVLVSALVPGSGPKARASKATGAVVARVALRPSVMKGWFDPTTRQLYLKWIRKRWNAVARRGIGSSPDAGREALANKILEITSEGIRLCFIYGSGELSLREFASEPLASAAETDAVSVAVVEGDVGASSPPNVQAAIVAIIADVVDTATPLET